MYLQLSRTSDDGFQTTGVLKAINIQLQPVLNLVTLEPPFLDNESKNSCIPCGNYAVVKRWSIKHGLHFQVLNVPDRSLILLHSGNFRKDSLGCILVGQRFNFIDFDSHIDISSSKIAMKSLIALMPYSFVLKIENEF